jgi:diadenosine tetraphosphate (Ap4A) HIT family hydrolase
MAQSWKPDDWERLITGEHCPVCDLIATVQQQDNHLRPIADMRFSRLFLAKNQYVPGYCVLICHRHVIEPYELAAEERALFFDDMSIAGQAVRAAFTADKMNYNILGNVVPHLHVHIIPRYFTDSAPNRPIDPTPQGNEVYLTAADYVERIALIQQHLEAR